MANIPYGAYTVQLGNAANNWANGALVYNAQVTQYKGNDVSSGFNPITTGVSFSVSLTHGTCTGTLSFSGGVYNSTTGNITGGSVTGPCLASGISADPSDTWSASASSSEDAAVRPRTAGA
jgi:hypothetical protein